MSLRKQVGACTEVSEEGAAFVCLLTRSWLWHSPEMTPSPGRFAGHGGSVSLSPLIRVGPVGKIPPGLEVLEPCPGGDAMCRGSCTAGAGERLQCPRSRGGAGQGRSSRRAAGAVGLLGSPPVFLCLFFHGEGDGGWERGTRAVHGVYVLYRCLHLLVTPAAGLLGIEKDP